MAPAKASEGRGPVAMIVIPVGGRSANLFRGMGPEGIAADELGKKGRFVGRGEALRLHLAQADPVAAPEELPGRLAAGEPAADNGYGFSRCRHKNPYFSPPP